MPILEIRHLEVSACTCHLLLRRVVLAEGKIQPPAVRDVALRFGAGEYRRALLAVVSTNERNQVGVRQLHLGLLGVLVALTPGGVILEAGGGARAGRCRPLLHRHLSDVLGTRPQVAICCVLRVGWQHEVVAGHPEVDQALFILRRDCALLARHRVCILF